jgi:hypothetical protein
VSPTHSTTAGPGAKIRSMATREQLHRDVDALPTPQVPKARIVVVEESDAEMVGVPESWKTFEDGTPQPDWTALIREDRDHGH